MIFVTSDLHFGHDKDFLYAPRGFTSINEHDEEVIRRWNSVVAPEDTVYVLGDMILNDNENGMNCISRLNGEIKIILGNHDSDERVRLYKNDLRSHLEVMGFTDIVRYKKYRFYMSHYPTLCGNYDDSGLHRATINLCGHAHTKDKWADWDKGIIYHCELDAHDCYPVSLDTIIEDLKQKITERKDEE